MKKILSFLFIFLLITFFGCKTAGIGQTDNKKYKINIQLPNKTWQVSSFSNKQAQFLEKKGTQGKISIMSIEVDEKQIPQVSKKSLTDIYKMIKTKTNQKGFTKVQDLPDKTINDQLWKGLEVTMEFKIANKKMDNLIQTIYLSKKGKSAFMVALNCPETKNTENIKDFEDTLSKISFEAIK